MVGDGEDKRKAARDKDTKEMADRGRDKFRKYCEIKKREQSSRLRPKKKEIRE